MSSRDAWVCLIGINNTRNSNLKNWLEMPRHGTTRTLSSLSSGILQLSLPKFAAHNLRHDFATRLINAGASVYQVQHQLAHSDPGMTQRYAHLLPENQNVVDKIDGKGTTIILLQSKEKELRQVP